MYITDSELDLIKASLSRSYNDEQIINGFCKYQSETGWELNVSPNRVQFIIAKGNTTISYNVTHINIKKRYVDLYNVDNIYNRIHISRNAECPF